MEHIKIALEKAQASQKGAGNQDIMNVIIPSGDPHGSFSGKHVTFSSPSQVQLDEGLMEANRIISHEMADPSHMAFNILRTKIYSVMRDNGWKSIAVSSPGVGCGKTMVSINLALSLARQTNCKTVLVDLDLRRPAVAKTLGINLQKPIFKYLIGKANIEECFVKVGENLILLLNNEPIRNSSEVMLHQRCKEIAQRLIETLAPDIILFDLPPVLSSDDTIGFLPCVDTSILVIAEGVSTYREVDECDRKLSDVQNFLGHVLNKSSDQEEIGYQYYGV